MKSKLLFLTLLITMAGLNTFSQQPAATLQSNPWSTTQLLQPAALITMMKTGKVLVYNIGVAEDIEGATHIGAASKQEKLELFKKAIKGISKDKTVVIYCGCCPMDKCPNIRPAFRAIKDASIKKAYLLNLPTNLKTDWIGKGFQLAEKQF
ncbi:MAG: rhodanese-like domain-containing protein [Pedobacter sp.]|nr:rhodanese-like domain-containing protein [Pedobacter sp.]